MSMTVLYGEWEENVLVLYNKCLGLVEKSLCLDFVRLPSALGLSFQKENNESETWI